ncbi:MAG: hypothetical protein QGH83_10350 [Candidatus Pacebacteria bacterium]|jgi:hypothetical protein|nr:hypothetical protein [Candidatus Paceibacterota bacterium]|tara:strand:+ start:69 stop:437 length:369 start_codon:yes stop_codon:yes gene_type:complete
MVRRFTFLVLAVCIGLTAYANPLTETTIQKDTYKTKDILLLFKSCYETIYFLGNTKYRGTRKPLKEDKVSKQCFCICDKIREKYPSGTFLDKQISELHKIIAPLSNECIEEMGPFWESMEDE